VFLTPLLAWLMLEATTSVSLAAVGRIFALLFLPFLLGHALRPWLLRFVAARPAMTILVDKGVILLAVYGAFSAATIDGVWQRLPREDLGLLVAVLLVLLGLVIAAAWLIGRLGRFDAPSRAAILFCGPVKSLVAGAPMARLLFPAATAGLIILPIMVFHTLQLIVSAWIAGALARRAGPA
jgi:sodium/bile acid cotransporter 7